ncbi:MAG: alpha/beta hydrolase [Brevirhabdus sp.]
MPRYLIAALFLVLGACVPRGAIMLAPEAAGIGIERTVFVATNRVPDDKTGQFGVRRDFDLNYARYKVSIPPAHRPGKIEWPDRKPDPNLHMLTTEDTRFANDTRFKTALRDELRSLPRDQREVVVFVHGYNANFAEGLYRMAQMAHDYHLPGLVVHYSWPSAANPLGYAYDRDSALFARDGLASVLRQLRKAGAERILLTAHSMGSLLTMETLRQLAIARDQRTLDSLQGVVLVSPDIDVDLFVSQAQRIGALPQPFVIFTSKRDRALALSARLTGQRERVGNVASVEELSNLDVTVIDVSNFDGDGMGHFVTATSPALIAILANINAYDASLQQGPSGRLGLLPGTVLTVQNATQIILPALP